jgi:hypothetical protein
MFSGPAFYPMVRGFDSPAAYHNLLILNRSIPGVVVLTAGDPQWQHFSL